MNGSVDAVAFNADGSRMFTSGGTAHVLLSVLIKISGHLGLSRFFVLRIFSRSVVSVCIFRTDRRRRGVCVEYEHTQLCAQV